MIERKCAWETPGWVCDKEAGHSRKHQAAPDWTKALTNPYRSQA